MAEQSNAFPLPPHLPPTETLFYPALADPSTLLLFIPGNPGLIAYYRSFLSTLWHLLDRNIAVLGVSHGGFDTRNAVHGRGGGEGATVESGLGGAPPFGLQAQIHQKVALVEWIVETYNKKEKACQDGRKLKLLVMGHSVGAFVGMEVLRILGENQRGGRCQNELEVVGGIMLFPTVTHIAQSPSGLRLSPLFHSPFLCHVIASFALVLGLILPRPVLTALIKLTTRFPPEAAEATAKMFASGGVKQALYLAREEMQQITTDRWGADIWGCSSTSFPKAPSLIFYFGKNDQWVADRTRDELIRSRARHRRTTPQDDNKEEEGEEKWKPRMMVCEEQIPHGFCISHGERMAGMVQGWVLEILGKVGGTQ